MPNHVPLPYLSTIDVMHSQIHRLTSNANTATFDAEFALLPTPHSAGRVLKPWLRTALIAVTVSVALSGCGVFCGGAGGSGGGFAGGCATGMRF